MENMHLEPITKEILEMLAKYTFTPERNFGIYDNISISGDGEYIEFYGETVNKEPVYDKHGELMDCNYNLWQEDIVVINSAANISNIRRIYDYIRNA